MMEKEKAKTTHNEIGDGEFLVELWKEVREQNKIYLEGFNDIKKKIRIFLIICSIFLTFLGALFLEIFFGNLNLPINNIFAIFIFLLFLASFSFLLAIIFSIKAIMSSRIKMPGTLKPIHQLKKYTPSGITKGLIKIYNKNIDYNTHKIDKKSGFASNVERLIIFGIFLIVSAIVLLLLF
jgi:hypothetical protein